MKISERGQITVQIYRKFIEERPYLACSVRDTGIGIRPQDKHKLFKPFGMIKSPESLEMNLQGSGLGLYICKSFTQHC